MVERLQGKLFVLCILIGLSLVSVNGCGTPLLDPKPFPVLNDNYVGAILADPAVLPAPCTSPSFTNGTLFLTCMPTDTDATALILENEMALWGYNISVSNWRTVATNVYAVTVNFTGDPINIMTPIKRILLMAALGRLGSSKNGVMQITRFSANIGTVWNVPVNQGPRLSLFYIDYPPIDEAQTSNAFEQWFCEMGWNVTVKYVNIDNNRTSTTNPPYVIVQEIRPEVDECASGANVCAYVCYNGSYPVGGYSCQAPDLVVFPVDDAAAALYTGVSALVSTIISGVKTVGITGITSSGNVTGGITLRYNIALNASIAGGNDIIAAIRPIINSQLAPMNPDRVTIVYNNAAIYITTLLAAQVTVRFGSSGSGLANARDAILDMSRLDSGSSDPIVTITEEENVIFIDVVYQEQIALVNSTAYRDAACTFYKAIFTPSERTKFESASGRTINLSTVSSTDIYCLPPAPDTSAPSPSSTGPSPSSEGPSPSSDAPSPPFQMAPAPGSGNLDTSTTSQMGVNAGVIVAIVLAVLALIFIVAVVYLYRLKKKREKQNKPFEEL